MSYFQQARQERAQFEASPSPQQAEKRVYYVISPAWIERYKWFIGIFFLVHLFYLLFLQTQSNVATNSLLRVISDLLVLIGAVVGTIACGVAAGKLWILRRSATDVIVRRAWIAVLFMCASVGAYAIGQAIWTWYEAVFSTFPFPAAYDPFYLAVYPFSWFGIALLMPRNSTVAGRTRLLVDALIAVASVLAISWYFILGPTLFSLSGSALEKSVALAYPLGDLSLCVAAALLLFGSSGQAIFNATLLRLSIGVTLLAATDSLYGFFQLQGTYHTGFLQDIGWPLSWLFIGWAILTYVNDLVKLGHKGGTIEQMRPSRLSTTGAAIRAVAPMVIALLTCGLLLIEVALRNTAPLVQVVIVCACLFLLPIIRQALTLVDNILLNERLRVALDQSQQAFQSSQQELMSTASRAEHYDELRTGIENLQAIHARLARGDFSGRAKVEGQLAPVAQSLNLLIDRMRGWLELVQQNRTLENEANLLAQILEMLSEGQSAVQAMPSLSGLPTSRALQAAFLLQNRLHMRFRHLHETTNLLEKHVHLYAQSIGLARQEEKISPQIIEQLLAQLESRLSSSLELTQELQRQTAKYLMEPESRTQPQETK
jgi:hypothetical protein